MTFGKRDAAAVVAEFLGTGVLTLLILSVQRSSIGVPFFVALAAGLAVAVMSFAVAGTSGGYFNPALTIGMWTARKLSSLKMVAYVIVQLLGGLAAYYVYTYFVNTKLQSLHGHYVGRILLAEAIGTGIFAFGWASMTYQRFSSAAAASVAGLALTLGIIAASGAATATMPAGLLNPAVALGAKAWVWGTYVLGPVVGALVGVNLYAWLFAENGTASAKAAVASPVSASASKPAAKRKTSRAKK